RLFQLVADGLERSFPRPRTPAAAAHNLPNPPSSFVGRRVEVEELREVIATRRLVSVVGPGGAGKTRLAIEAASAFAPTAPGEEAVELAAPAGASPNGHVPGAGMAGADARRALASICPDGVWFAD